MSVDAMETLEPDPADVVGTYSLPLTAAEVGAGLRYGYDRAQALAEDVRANRSGASAYRAGCVLPSVTEGLAAHAIKAGLLDGWFPVRHEPLRIGWDVRYGRVQFDLLVETSASESFVIGVKASGGGRVGVTETDCKSDFIVMLSLHRMRQHAQGCWSVPVTCLDLMDADDFSAGVKERFTKLRERCDSAGGRSQHKTLILVPPPGKTDIHHGFSVLIMPGAMTDDGHNPEPPARRPRYRC